MNVFDVFKNNLFFLEGKYFFYNFVYIIRLFCRIFFIKLENNEMLEVEGILGIM